MIVRNEAKRITRTLASVLPVIDSWLICDTGSTDGTQDIIRQFFAEKDKTGELVERPWRDFAHNRSEALAFAKDRAAYSLIIDAGETIELDARFRLPTLILDSYLMETVQGGLVFQRTRLVRNTLPWMFEGVLHEFLSCGRDAKGNRMLPDSRSQRLMRGIRVVTDDDAAAQDPGRFARDAAVLSAALAAETDPFLTARYTFYLAQSHRDAGEPEKALTFYDRRATQGFWTEEVYVSHYEAAKLRAQLGRPDQEVLDSYAAASRAVPQRAEALHGAARFCRERQRYREGYGFARRAVGMAPKVDALFLERWIYEYGALDEYAVNAYWSGHHEESLKACERLLAPGSALPAEYRARIEDNARFAREKIAQTSSVAAKRAADAASRTGPRRLCLNMIVKNEMANLERCLTAVADHIDCWVIGDTGSTDGTQEFIRNFFAARDIPGELHEFPFHNFEQARNQALDHAYASPLDFDYLLFDDADMELVVDDPDFRGKLEAPGYHLLQKSGDVSYWNMRLVRRDTGARYRGVTHEFIDVEGGGTEFHGAWYVDHASGSNRVEKFERDVRLLRAALETEPDNARYWFYLAQSYRDAGQHANAIEAYRKRVALGGWAEEAWMARLQVARSYRALGDEPAFVTTALTAFSERPQRAEPVYDLARHYREKGDNQAAGLFAEYGITIPRPDKDVLFIEDHVYTAGLLEEYAIAANYSADPVRKDRGFSACNYLALNRGVGAGARTLARSNLFFYADAAGTLLPSFRAQRLAFAVPAASLPGLPAIMRLGDAFAVAQELVGSAATPDGSRACLLMLNGDLAVRDGADIAVTAGRAPLQDLRFFAHDGAPWAIAASAGGHLVAPVLQDGGRFRTGAWQTLSSGGIPEDGPLPQSGSAGLRFVTAGDPWQVLDQGGAVIATHSPAVTTDHLRRGTPLLPFDGGWLALVREVHWHDRRRHDLHRLVWLDAGDRPASISRPFHLGHKGSEIAAGLAFDAATDSVLVSWCSAGTESWLGRVSAADIRFSLEPVDGLSDGRDAAWSRKRLQRQA